MTCRSSSCALKKMALDGSSFYTSRLTVKVSRFWIRVPTKHTAVVVIQALHHASIHGEQVCKALEAMGFEPPDLQPWAYADETGRSRWLWTEG
jgi:hypothetical protein